MLVIIGAIFGAVIGGTIAKRRGGKTLDVVQYVGVYALAFALLGMIATLVVHRLAL